MMNFKTSPPGLFARAGFGAAILVAAMAAAVAQPAPGGMPGGPGMMQHGGPGMRGEGAGMMGMHRGMRGEGGDMMGMRGGEVHRMERMLGAAGASPDQRVKVHQIMKAAHDDMQKLLESGRGARQQMTQLLVAPKLDAAAVEAQRQKMSALHDAASKRMTQAVLDASAVLTPEQRERMASTIKARRDMVERHRRERETLDPARHN